MLSNEKDVVSHEIVPCVFGEEDQKFARDLLEFATNKIVARITGI